MALVTEFHPTNDGGYRSNIASEAVEAGLEKYKIYGDESLAVAMTHLSSLADAAVQITSVPQISDQLGTIENTANAYVHPDKPVEPEIIPSFPDATPAPNLQEVGAIDINQDIPIFDKDDPTIREIVAPNKFNKSAPVIPVLAEHALPDAREINIPTLQALRDITLPDDIDLMDHAFEGVAPGGLDAYAIPSFLYAENKYSSDLQDKLDLKLLEYVDQNITGLDPAIEQQLFDRGRERTGAVTQANIDRIERNSAASGWEQPTGNKYEAEQRARQLAAQEDIAESRNIEITQANLIQQKFHTSLAMALQNESQLIQHNDNFAQRAFESARYAVQSAIDISGLLTSQYNTKAQVYNTYANVYKIRVDADLGRLEQVRIKLEGQKLIGELNQQDVQRFKAEIEGQALIQGIYKDELDAVRLLLEQDKLKIDNVGTEARIFESEIKAKALEYESFRDEQQGELIKVQSHETLAKIYDTKMNGYETLSKIKIAIQDSDIKVKQELPLEVSRLLADINKTETQAESGRIDALTKLFQTRANVFETEVRGESGRVESEVKIVEQELKLLVAESDVRIESLKGNISAMLAETELMVELKKAIAQIASQLASSALSTVNISAGVSEGATNASSRSTTYSVGNKTSHSHSKNYDD